MTRADALRPMHRSVLESLQAAPTEGLSMSREAFGDPPERQEAPDLCPVCGNDWHAEDCVFGKEVARRLKAERDAHRMQFALHRLWPAIERAMSGLVFTADRAGEVQADMNTLREYSKTQEFECLGEPSLCDNPRGCACVPDSKTPNAEFRGRAR